MSGALQRDADVVSVLTRLVRYLKAIHFWQDEDSGHWEEQRKVSASSLGTVVAGLDVFATLMRQQGEWRQECGLGVGGLASDLAERGRQAQQRLFRANARSWTAPGIDATTLRFCSCSFRWTSSQTRKWPASCCMT